MTGSGYTLRRLPVIHQQHARDPLSHRPVRSQRGRRLGEPAVRSLHSTAHAIERFMSEGTALYSPFVLATPFGLSPGDQGASSVGDH
eukprot:1111061-Prymnesium_polylepis.1